MDRIEAAKYLPPAYNHKDVVAGLGFGTNDQLINTILRGIPKAVQQLKYFAPWFRRNMIYETCQAIFDWERKNIKYVADNRFFQYPKLPAALNSTGVGDCKSFTWFTAGILINLGIPCEIDFAGYDKENYPAVNHVYVRSGEITIDACPVHNKKTDKMVYLPFNIETPYLYKKKYPMEIAVISGAEYDEMIGKGNVKKVVNKVKATVKKDVKKVANVAKTVIKQEVKAIKKVGNVVKKVVASPSRTAFLQLVKLNIHSYATKLRANEKKAFDLWKKLGGNTTELNAAINTGQRRKPILGISRWFDQYMTTGIGCPQMDSDGIGFDPVTDTAALLAAAAPVIAAFALILKEIKRTTDQAKQVVTTNTGQPPPDTGGENWPGSPSPGGNTAAPDNYGGGGVYPGPGPDPGNYVDNGGTSYPGTDQPQPQPEPDAPKKDNTGLYLLGALAAIAIFSHS